MRSDWTFAVKSLRFFCMGADAHISRGHQCDVWETRPHRYRASLIHGPFVLANGSFESQCLIRIPTDGLADALDLKSISFSSPIDGASNLPVRFAGIMDDDSMASQVVVDLWHIIDVGRLVLVGTIRMRFKLDVNNWHGQLFSRCVHGPCCRRTMAHEVGNTRVAWSQFA